MELNTESTISPTWLLQRAKAKPAIRDFYPTMLTSEFLKLDYMGNAEFEFGAFRNFLIEVDKKISNLGVFSVRHNEMTLFFSCPNDSVKEYSEILKNIIEQKQPLKAGSRINSRETIYQKVGKKEKPIFDDPSAPYQFDTWLDYTNNLFVSRDELVIKCLMTTIKNSANHIRELEKDNK